MPGLRVGQGVDIHRYRSGDDGDSIVLGGVHIPHHTGIEAHSDGDALLHAISDAMLGAVALGDIGQLFPDTDARYAGADSGELLGEVVKRVEQQGFRLVNLDATLVLRAPMLQPFIVPMRANIASLTGLAHNAVSVKATRPEWLGVQEISEGIMAFCTVLLMAYKE